MRLTLERLAVLHDAYTELVDEVTIAASEARRAGRRGLMSTRVVFDSAFLPILGNGQQTEFRFSVTPRDYLTMDVYEAGSLQRTPDEEIEIAMVGDAEIVVHFAAPLPIGARYSLVLGWRR